MGETIKRNLNERVTAISNELHIPKITVEKVILSYINGIHMSVENGEDVTIDTIVSIKQKIINGEKHIRGRLSKTIKIKNK